MSTTNITVEMFNIDMFSEFILIEKIFIAKFAFISVKMYKTDA